ncbi:ATP-binding cassette domain-containing protein [Catenisphaera adipataccumulans]|jgi:ATP-binding cassette subfamily F protein 3|uniref:ATPase subunit of ABC transporter with duplicated ATPase domains n=1 Tax=Catenisphaera adipataccumulans TaxID=700500 RepID=A0A7W8CYQ1_9FIRM|nr:ATP-binding cassette domain-containing protein [Catenisphaera adipataccumulans]MBB5183826.1 ATPase subunit of ABC transporter with duplicated ATPase domains [Catenisphaera adipataccumulans]
MLICSQLSASLANGRTLFPAVTLSVNDHDRIGLIAEEGDGKSTFLKLIAHQPAPYVTISGTVYNIGKAGYLPQQLPLIWKDTFPMDFLLKEHPEDEIPWEAYNRLSELDPLKTDVNFLYEERPISTLSGGEKVRLQLLKLSMSAYDYFCLDEPTNDLDLETLEWLEQWILSRSEPVLFVSHDVTFLEHTATRLVHFEQRNKKTKPVVTVFNGPYDDYIHQRMQNRQKEIQVSESEKRQYMAQKQRINNIYNQVQSDLRSVSRQAPNVAKNLKDKMRSVKATKQRIEDQSYHHVDSLEEEINIVWEGTPLAAQRIVLDFHEPLKIETRTLIEQVDLTVKGRDKIVITGQNGAGKTYLLKTFYQRLQKDPGILLGYMPQNYTDFFEPDDTPVSFLHRVTKQTDVQTMLGSLKFLPEEMTQQLSDCSYGQQAKVYLAYLTLNGCNVIIMDEPSRNLSPLSLPVLIRWMEEYPGCLICVSHDRALIRAAFTAHYRIQNKRWEECS